MTSTMWERKPALAKLLAVLLALCLWQAAAMTLHLPLLLVSPLQVAARLLALVQEAAFWRTVAFSVLRIVGGFLLAFVLGCGLALLAGRFPLVETLLWPYMAAVKSVPVASFIILALWVLRASRLAVFFSVLMVLPILYSNVLQGFKSTDPQLLEMARLYRVPWLRRLGYLYLPAIRPYLLSACSVALGMSWKAGVAAEVIGVVSGSIGEKLYEAKIYFLTEDLFAWTVVILLCGLGFEKAFTRLLAWVFDGWEGR